MTRTAPAESDPDETDSEAEVSNSEMRTQNNPPVRDHIEQLEWLIHLFFEAIRKPCYNVKRIAKYLMVERGGYKAFDDVALWLARNPLSSFALLIVSLISLPFLLFIGFGIGIIAVTFTGFIVLEGTLLTFVSVLSFGCLGALVIVLTLILSIALSVYMGFAYIYDMYGTGKITALTEYLKREHTSDNRSINQNRTNTASRQDQHINSFGTSS